MKFLATLHAYYLALKDDEQGASAIEYAIIAGLIAVGIILAATNLGTEISSLFSYIGGKLP